MSEPSPQPLSDHQRSTGLSSRLYIKDQSQASRYVSPWSRKEKIGMLLWLVVYHTLFRPTPKQLKKWRLFLLKVFGATISGRPFVHGQAFIKIPWLITLHDRAALGPGSEVYNLARVTLKERCVVSQYAYLCAGTHDLSDPELPLVVGEIEVGPEVFIGAKALVLPGVKLGAGSVLGAGAVATKDLEPWTIYGGNPARPIKKREMRGAAPR